MTPTISKELQEQIEQEAEAYAEKTGDRIYNIKEYFTHPERHAGYAEGATIYATRWEQAKKALDRLKSVADCYSYIPSLNPPIKHLQSLINEALASWKEEGKEVNNA